MPLLSFLPESYQGAIIMLAGFVLLLHTLGFLEKGLQYLLIGGAVYMIIVGFVKMRGLELVQNILTKKTPNK